MNPYHKHILAFGAGVDSTALLAIELNRDQAAALIGVSRTELDQAFPKLDVVMFADTGREKKATYQNAARFAVECGRAGLPFYRVQNRKETLPQWLERTGTIPLMPGGRHLCSLKFKTEVMHAEAEAMFPGRFTWAVGMESGETRRARFQDSNNDTHKSAYPLRNLGLDRGACIALIAKLGYGLVVKSSCPFCPFMQPEEIKEVIETDPESWELVKSIERNFQATSPRKHQAWIDAGRPTRSDGKAPAGMWRKDSWAEGARLFAKRVNGKQISVTEWEAILTKKET